MNRSLISPTSNAILERALLEKLARRSERIGSLGELEPLAVRIGLMQNTLKPRFKDPQMVLMAADHGIAVNGIAPPYRLLTHELVRQLLEVRLPVAVFARMQRIKMTVIDAGVAVDLPAHDNLMVRKIAHGTRNARTTSAMTIDQAHAAIRAGMEFGDKLPGNVVICSGVGVGSRESASLVLSRLVDAPVRDLLLSGQNMSADQFSLLMTIAQGAQARHRDVTDPVEVLAAFGGFEIAMMAGLMLVAAGKRHMLMVDGMPALAALMLASRIAPPVTDYCVFCRSDQHQGLDQALALFRASALLELGMDSIDGTGASLAWPLVNNAAALLTDVPEGEEPGPTLPQGIDMTEHFEAAPRREPTGGSA
jgi:nicotinate-nucleotide--dimethylbenzimidazole phosphoribosyltransferase